MIQALSSSASGNEWRYGPAAQFFHWITVLLVLAAYAFSPGGSEQEIYSADAEFGRRVHETLGFSVFVVVLSRVLWRAIDRKPEAIPMKLSLRMSAIAIQGLLYVLLFALPLTAISGVWLEGHALTLLGRINFVPMMPTLHELGLSLASTHGWLGNAILWIAGVHAAGAIYHHLVLKDRVLQSMLPARRRRSASRATSMPTAERTLGKLSRAVIKE